ncbi:MAG TPA: metallophosphoesterase [Patescibacteria group bacterium]|nr:metallophosphoesterase [Patescibacteria group bacterium]
MKYIITIIFLLLLIVLGVFWFVNRELITLHNSTQNISSMQPSLENSWQFAVIGDTEGIHTVTKNMIEDLKLRPLTFVVHVGDISSHGNETEMQEVKTVFATLPFPTYYIPGNNDLIFDESLQIKTLEAYKNVFGNTTYQSFNAQNAHFVLLDNSYRRFGFASEELEWLQNDLAHNTQPLTFLFFHRPLNLPGEQLFGDDETTASRKQNEKFKSLITPYTISHIFNGHIHTSLNYNLNSIPVTVTGGGGALPQEMLGGKSVAQFHYVLVTVQKTSDHPTYRTETIRFTE